ncbi:MAG: bifunctional diaminohydroxyphosphoribosylaminopyrimidine deaminase/5-amino-6-(5-phosphoribosylamino)uracil reductase RibD [Bacteroidetes bacterium]|nr:bifunctional diaminohydroxyphosphoribosylaminopyrimidine deaminase/5-amino-6-(5-phosphoribosylamino)uracil reductase RibD [Bacteroidota bacterium]
MTNHEKYMRRCLQLAKLGEGHVAPNPMVGAVLVYKDRIIGEGYHQQFGKAHAEVNCIQSVHDESLLPASTLYVSLEPCSHFAKTPPCSDLIIKNKIGHVVVGITDNSDKVNGKGIAQLRNAGVHVTKSVLERECYEINRFFFTANKLKRPYVILKWAQSADGFIAPDVRQKGKIEWISNQISQMLVHKWRASIQAIMAGTQTIIDDNPQLTTRNWHGHNPVKVIIDKNLRIPSQANVFQESGNTIVYTSMASINQPNAEMVIWERDRISIKNILDDLYNRHIHSLMVEGGAALLQSFMEDGLWDEAQVFISNKKLEQGVKAPVFEGVLQCSEMLGNDQLNCYHPTYRPIVDR